METTGHNSDLALPPDLAAELEAMAEQEQRPAQDVLRDAVGRYRQQKQRERQVFRVGDLSAAELAAIAATEMDSRHDHLNAELE